VGVVCGRLLEKFFRLNSFNYLFFIGIEGVLPDRYQQYGLFWCRASDTTDWLGGILYLRHFQPFNSFFSHLLYFLCKSDELCELETLSKQKQEHPQHLSRKEELFFQLLIIFSFESVGCCD